ncbi:MAG: o-succinylbenzoate synthase [Planctomycetes bacterium]|nr:o-succinylbenzoate synthase [Planctomycetota bacterium]
MKIERVEMRHVRLPLREPFETSFGVEPHRSSLLVRVQGDGVEGWGEAPVAEFPGYGPETAATAWHVTEEFLVPRVIGRRFDSGTEMQLALAPVRGHSFAKSAVECALQDALARSRRISVARLLGGVRDRVPVGVSLGVEATLDALVARARPFVEKGYRRLKIKIKPGWDREPALAMRRAYPDVPLMVDANSAYSMSDVALFDALDALGLLMIEQPFGHEDLVEHADLQARLKTPICLDESAANVAAVRAAIRLRAGRIVNIKMGRVGGPTCAVRVHDLCREAGIAVWCGGMLETGIGRAHNVALASLPHFTLPADLSESARYFHEDVVDPPFTVGADGHVAVPTGPGIGVSVKLDFVERITTRKRDF